MSGRKIIAVLLCMLCAAILYLSAQDSRTAVDNTGGAHPNNVPQLVAATEAPKSPSTNKSSMITQNNAAEKVDIFECIPELSFDEEARNKQIDQYLQSLGEHQSTDSSLYYALFSPVPSGGSRIDLLFEHYEQQSDNPIYSLVLSSSCVNAKDARCTSALISNIIDTDRNNGAIWLNAIAFYAAKRNDPAVIGSIDALATSDFFNERFGEGAFLYAQALQASEFNDFNVNALQGVTISAQNTPPFSPITQWCKQGVAVQEKAQACQLLGEQLESRGKTLITQLVGISLQQMVFESQENTQGTARLENTRHKLMTGNRPSPKASIMMMLDERLLRGWLDNVDFYGEVESQRLLTEEAELMYEQNENQLCTLIYDVLGVF